MNRAEALAEAKEELLHAVKTYDRFILTRGGRGIHPPWLSMEGCAKRNRKRRELLEENIIKAARAFADAERRAVEGR